MFHAPCWLFPILYDQRSCSLYLSKISTLLRNELKRFVLLHARICAYASTRVRVRACASAYARARMPACMCACVRVPETVESLQTGEYPIEYLCALCYVMPTPKTYIPYDIDVTICHEHPYTYLPWLRDVILECSFIQVIWSLAFFLQGFMNVFLFLYDQYLYNQFSRNKIVKYPAAIS